MNKLPRSIWILPVLCLFCFSAVSAQIASGGSYTLNQAVVASGGGTSNDAGNLYKVEGTSGQAAAGTLSTSSAYTTRGGFWAPNPFAPTAAVVGIGGRVLGTGNEGLRNVTVTLTGGTLSTPRVTRTNTFGNFKFEDVEVGQVYTVSVQSKKYGFPQESQVFSLMDGISDILFQAAWEN
jgi:hypothetical protein